MNTIKPGPCHPHRQVEPTANKTFAALGIFCIIYLAYFQVLSNDFGILDDYYFLYNSVTERPDTLPLLIGAGRPLNALLLDWGFSLAGSIEGLALLRLFTLLGIWIFGFGFYLFSRLQHLDFSSSLLIAAGIVLLPSFHVYASWAQHFTTPYAGALSLLSASILLSPQSCSKSLRALPVLCSAFILLAALLIYQPLAMVFWSGVLISFFPRIDSSKGPNTTRLLEVLLAFSLAMAAALVAFKYGQHLYPGDSSRYGLAVDIYGKILWFFTEPLTNALSLHFVPKCTLAQTLVVVIATSGLLILRISRGTPIALGAFIIASLSVIASYAPNLATAENWASYRSIGALATTILVLLILSSRQILLYIYEKYKPHPAFHISKKPLHVLATLMLFLLAILTQTSINKGFILPNVTETNNLASFLRSVPSTPDKEYSFAVKTSSWRDSDAKVLLYDEFGMHSSTREYYSLAMVKLVLRGMGLAPKARVSLLDEESQHKASDHSTFILIDFAELATSQRFKENPPGGSLSTSVIYPADINDSNWTAGIWANDSMPDSYSFTYKPRYGDIPLKVGDKLKLERSGIRTILKIETGREYINILVDGPAIRVADGFPKTIQIYK